MLEPGDKIKSFSPMMSSRNHFLCDISGTEAEYNRKMWDEMYEPMNYVV